ncbi:cystatin-C-like [Lemur catta]|uniref:cystatin-C-like n=1 Tax=Lemur catta TaxID=9447 RepID=UPI001E26E63B|nr:cystatin-C-like [Lemur catta]
MASPLCAPLLLLAILAVTLAVTLAKTMAKSSKRSGGIEEADVSDEEVQQALDLPSAKTTRRAMTCTTAECGRCACPPAGKALLF